MDIPFLLSPTEDHAALPQPPLPQGSLLLSVLQALASARRIKFRLFSGTFKALCTGTQFPFGLMSLVPHRQPLQELTNQAPGQMLARPLHLLPVHFPSTSMGPSTRATSSTEPSLIPCWRELCPLLENRCARTAHLDLSSPLPQRLCVHPWVSLFLVLGAGPCQPPPGHRVCVKDGGVAAASPSAWNTIHPSCLFLQISILIFPSTETSQICVVQADVKG